MQDLRIGGRGSNAQYQFTLQTDDLNELNQWAPTVLKKLRTIHILTDVSSDQQNSGLEANVVVDRDSASRLGLSQQAIDDTLYDAFGQRQVSTMYTPLNQYHVVMEVAPEFWQNPTSLDQIFVMSNTGQLVRLSTFTHFAPEKTALAVNHQGQFPSVTISFNLAPGVALGDAVDAISQAEQQIHMPAGIRGTFQGTAQAFQDSLKGEGFLIAFALFAVYIVLGILYESYIHPITILSTLPSAGVGAILALLLFHIELSVIALISMILFIGIVKKNAIMMIDFALEAQRGEGKSPARTAIYQACVLRFRPIVDRPAWPRCSAACRSRSETAFGSRDTPPTRNRNRRRIGGKPGADALHDTGNLSVHGPRKPDGRTVAPTTRPPTNGAAESHVAIASIATASVRR